MHYNTISKSSEGLYKEKGSKFIAKSFYVENEKMIDESLDQLRKDYHDARHHCYAYIYGLKNQKYRANDDGEPNHSAGDPILGQIKSHGLTNVLVVVIRYFGGTKLGVGGLIHAYKTAADEALSKSGRQEIFDWKYFQFAFEYSQTGLVERLITEHDIVVIHRLFEAECKFEVKVVADDFDKVVSDFAENGLKISVSN